MADPEVNLLVMGPHPVDPSKTVFHWYEMSDAVQDETYIIDNIEVSNFVLPLYFTGNDEPGGRNDFLGRSYGGKALNSFGINPGGYVGFYNPDSGEHETYSHKGDKIAKKRLKLKGKAKSARRSQRYSRFTVTPKSSKRGKVQRAASAARESLIAPQPLGLDTPGRLRKTGI